VSGKEQYEVVDGGNKFDLLAQPGDIGRIRHSCRPYFTLKIESVGWITVLVNGLVAEDGSGDCWVISGYLSDETRARLSAAGSVPVFSGSLFHGFYNTKAHKGWIKPRD
jgi:hypothetical protein